MPTYEYACAACGNRYEKREGFDAKPRQKCPKCGKMAQRLLSRPAVVFKGSGFYKTDSRASKESSSESPSSEPSPGDSGSAPAKPAPDAGGAGHSHGAGGHTHDAPAASEKKKTSTETSAEKAAAP